MMIAEQKVEKINVILIILNYLFKCLIMLFGNIFDLLIEISFKVYMAKFFFKIFTEISKIAKEIIFFIYNIFSSFLSKFSWKKVITFDEKVALNSQKDIIKGISYFCLLIFSN